MSASATRLTQFGREAYPRLSLHLKQRMRRYDVELMLPDFNSQVAQFCQEVLVCAKMGQNLDDYAQSEPKSPERYGERLCGWWNKWSASPIASKHEEIHQKLIECLAQLKTIKSWGKDTKEVYKMELWVRYKPHENARQLALWGGSMGILIDRKILKYERIGLATKNASVRSFIEGKPIWLDRADLSKPDVRPRRREWIERLDGRWDRYLSVPIRLVAENEPQLTVGVVTLAAMRATKDRTNIPMNVANEATLVVEMLEAFGIDLLRP